MFVPLLLLRGQTALVDDSDYPFVAQYRWRLNNKGYVVRSHKVGSHERVVCLHRELMNAKRGEVVDHIDHDKLNNTRANLRIITQQQNLMYRRRFCNNRSGYKGVTFLHGKWHPRIQLDERVIHLGFYDDLVTAAKVYDAAAMQLFGEFALLNFPDMLPEAEMAQMVAHLLKA